VLVNRVLIEAEKSSNDDPLPSKCGIQFFHQCCSNCCV